MSTPPPGPTDRHGSLAAEAIDALAAGSTIVAAHDSGATLIYAAAAATVSQTAFAIRHGSGFLQVTVATDRCDELMLPRATPMFGAPYHSTYKQCVAVDAAHGIGTGISATDRTHTVRLLAAPVTNPSDLVRPGHVIPIAIDQPAGLPSQVGGRDIALVAAIAVEIATGSTAAVITELVADNGPAELPTPQQAHRFAAEHGLEVIDLPDLAYHLKVLRH